MYGVSNDIGSLPVVDDAGHLLGIFTERDVLRGLHKRGTEFCQARIGDVMTRIVPDVKQMNLKETPSPAVYVPHGTLPENAMSGRAARSFSIRLR